MTGRKDKLIWTFAVAKFQGTLKKKEISQEKKREAQGFLSVKWHQDSLGLEAYEREY